VAHGGRVERLQLPPQRHDQQAWAGRQAQHLAAEAERAHVALGAQAVQQHHVRPLRRVPAAVDAAGAAAGIVSSGGHRQQGAVARQLVVAAARPRLRHRLHQPA
jgi:hypothetical protein